MSIKDFEKFAFGNKWIMFRDDPPTKNSNGYQQWITNNGNLLMVHYATDQVVVGFQNTSGF